MLVGISGRSVSYVLHVSLPLPLVRPESKRYNWRLLKINITASIPFFVALSLFTFQVYFCFPIVKMVVSYQGLGTQTEAWFFVFSI